MVNGKTKRITAMKAQELKIEFYHGEIQDEMIKQKEYSELNHLKASHSNLISSVFGKK